MPRAEIISANSKYTPPHERKNGPWDEYELDEAGRHLDHAEQIKANPKMVEAVAKHHKKKAKHHQQIAESLSGPMKRGLVSETAATKASMKDLEANRKNNHG